METKYFGSKCGCWIFRFSHFQILLLELYEVEIPGCDKHAFSRAHSFHLVGSLFCKGMDFCAAAQKGCRDNCLSLSRPFTVGCGGIPLVWWWLASFISRNMTSLSFWEYGFFLLSGKESYIYLNNLCDSRKLGYFKCSFKWRVTLSVVYDLKMHTVLFTAFPKVNWKFWRK